MLVIRYLKCLKMSQFSYWDSWFKGTVSLFWTRAPMIALTILMNEFIVKVQNSSVERRNRASKSFFGHFLLCSGHSLTLLCPGYSFFFGRHNNKWPGHNKEWPGHNKEWPGHNKEWPGHNKEWPGHNKKWPGHNKKWPENDFKTRFLLSMDEFWTLTKNSFIRMVKAIIGALVQNSDTVPLNSRQKPRPNLPKNQIRIRNRKSKRQIYYSIMTKRLDHFYSVS